MSESLLNKYHQYLQQYNIAIPPNGIKAEMQALLVAIENFVSLFEQQTTGHWNGFMQQLVQLWVAEEYMARPPVSIISIPTLSRAEAAYAPQKEIKVAKFTQLLDRLKQVVGYTGDHEFTVYPLLHLIKCEFDNQKECRWELEYVGQELPDNFTEISLFLDWHEQIELCYDLMWFWHDCRCQHPEISLHFPTYAYDYPGDDVSTPYRHSLNYLSPYPHLLDLFLELRGLGRKHFKWDEVAHVWRATLIWQSIGVSVVEPDQLTPRLLPHCFPLFHWVKKNLDVIQQRDRVWLAIEDQRLIWLKMGSHSEMMPLPYYLHQSLDRRMTGYWCLREDRQGQELLRYVEVSTHPESQGEGEKIPMLVQAVVSHEFTGKLGRHPELGEGNIVNTIASKETWLPFAERGDQGTGQREQILREHEQFWNKCRFALKTWDAATLAQTCRFFYSDCVALCDIVNCEIKPCTTQFIVSSGLYQVVPIVYTVNKLHGKTWFCLQRFYRYLKERAPLSVIPSFHIQDQQGKMVAIFSLDLGS